MSKPHSLDRVFAEHESPQHCDKRDLHDGLRPVAALVAREQKQMIEYRAALSDALLEDDAEAGINEHIDQTIAAQERDVTELARLVRRIASNRTQLDRYLAERMAAVRAKR